MAVSLHDLLSYPESLRVAWSCCDELFLFYALWMWHSWRSGCGRSAKLAGLQRLKGSAPAFSSLSDTNQDYWAGCSQKSSLLFIHSAQLQLKFRHKWLLFVYAKMGYFCFVCCFWDLCWCTVQCCLCSFWLEKADFSNFKIVQLISIKSLHAKKVTFQMGGKKGKKLDEGFLWNTA